MKILYIHPSFTIYGGAEKVILDLFRRTKRDFNTELYTLFYSKYIERESGINWVSQEGPYFNSIFGFKINPFIMRHIKTLGKLLAERYEPGDIIMMTLFPSALILNEAIKLNPAIGKGSNYLFSFEPDRLLYYSESKRLGYLPEDLYSFKFKLTSILAFQWKRTDYRVIQKYIKEIFTLSDYVTKQTAAIYTNNKVRKATELYVDLNLFKIDSKIDSRQKIESYYKLGLMKDDIILLSQSRIEKSKGIFELVDIVKKINAEKSNPKLKLLIGGTGSLIEELKKRIKGMGNVFLLGFIPSELLPYLYGSSDIFVALPRKETGGPLTILEAMYAESIVIGSNEAGPPELIDHNKTGFLVDPNNSTALVNMLKQACDLVIHQNHTFKEMQTNAKNKVIQKYTFENFYNLLITSLTDNRVSK